MTESVVVHYRDGQLLKGQTTGFSGENSEFEVQQLHGGPQAITVEFANLKAVFFVKDFVGNSAYDEVKAFRAGSPTARCPDGSRPHRRGDTGWHRRGLSPQRPGLFPRAGRPQFEQPQVLRRFNGCDASVRHLVRPRQVRPPPGLFKPVNFRAIACRFVHEVQISNLPGISCR